MQGRVYETVKRPSVRLYVCTVDRPQQRRAAGLLLSARQTGDIDRLLHGAPPALTRTLGCRTHQVSDLVLSLSADSVAPVVAMATLGLGRTPVLSQLRAPPPACAH